MPAPPNVPAPPGVGFADPTYDTGTTCPVEPPRRCFYNLGL